MELRNLLEFVIHPNNAQTDYGQVITFSWASFICNWSVFTEHLWNGWPVCISGALVIHTAPGLTFLLLPELWGCGGRYYLHAFSSIHSSISAHSRCAALEVNCSPTSPWNHMGVHGKHWCFLVPGHSWKRMSVCTKESSVSLMAHVILKTVLGTDPAGNRQTPNCSAPHLESSHHRLSR